MKEAQNHKRQEAKAINILDTAMDYGIVPDLKFPEGNPVTRINHNIKYTLAALLLYKIAPGIELDEASLNLIKDSAPGIAAILSGSAVGIDILGVLSDKTARNPLHAIAVVIKKSLLEVARSITPDIFNTNQDIDKRIYHNRKSALITVGILLASIPNPILSGLCIGSLYLSLQKHTIDTTQKKAFEMAEMSEKSKNKIY